MSTITVPGLTAGTWTIDPVHSEVGFSVRHLMVSKVKGVFDKFEGTIVVAEDPLASSVQVSIDVSSINTREENRDNHLRSPDFFESDKYPSITFMSTSVTPKGNDYVITGDLAIKGTTKQVTLDLEFNGVSGDPWGGTRAGFSAATEISRSDFGIDISMPLDGGGVVVGEKVKITLEVEAVLAQG